jgi:GR25 family glycosyltransferase involved in LPS biosynthesis
MQDLPCFCINLDDRTDKWADTQAAFQGTGIVPKRFSGIKHSEGWRGCGASHVAIAREAMRRGLPWVLIVEDDCVPVADFAARWPVVKQALWDDYGHWDIFLGGPTYIQGPVELHGKHLIEIEGAFALHFYVLQAASYEKVIAWNPDRHGPIDVYYSDILRIVTTYPLLAKQRPSLSDIRQEQTDYSYFFDESEHIIKQLTYALRTRNGTVGLLFLSIVVLAALWLKRSRK